MRERAVGGWRWFRGRRWWWQVAGWVGAAFLALIMIGVATGTEEPVDEALAAAVTASASATVATETASPTETATPSSTPTSTPSPTPTATATATPTATPSPTEAACPTPAEVRFIATVEEQVGEIAAGLSSFGDLAQQVGESSFIIFDEDWRSEMVLALVRMHLGAQTLADLDTGGVDASLSAPVARLANDTQLMIDLTTRGIDDLDSAALLDATDVMGGLPAHVTAFASARDGLCE